MEVSSSGVKEAVKLNRVLMYINEHQNCIVEQQKNDIAQLQGQVVQLKVQIQSKPAETSHIQLEQDIAVLKQQLKSVESEKDTLEKENKTLKSKYQDGIAKLDDAHRLIQRHLQNAEMHKEEATANSEKLKETQKQMDGLKFSVDKISKDLQIQKSLHEDAVTSWKEQDNKFKEEVNELKCSLTESRKACRELEELNSSWATQNMEISHSLKEARAKLDVTKEESWDQTDLCMLNMADMECQVTVNLQSSVAQTEPPNVLSVDCQISPVTMTTYTQTVVAPVINREAQTETCTIPERSDISDNKSSTKESDLENDDQNGEKILCSLVFTDQYSDDVVIIEEIDKEQSNCSVVVQQSGEIRSSESLGSGDLSEKRIRDDGLGSGDLSGKRTGDDIIRTETEFQSQNNGKNASKVSDQFLQIQKSFNEEFNVKFQHKELSQTQMLLDKDITEGPSLMVSEEETVHQSKTEVVDVIPPTQKTTSEDLCLEKPKLSAASKTSGKRRLCSTEWKMEVPDQSQGKRIQTTSGIYQPDVNSLWSRKSFLNSDQTTPAFSTAPSKQLNQSKLVFISEQPKTDGNIQAANQSKLSLQKMQVTVTRDGANQINSNNVKSLSLKSNARPSSVSQYSNIADLKVKNPEKKELDFRVSAGNKEHSSITSSKEQSKVSSQQTTASTYKDTKLAQSHHAGTLAQKEQASKDLSFPGQLLRNTTLEKGRPNLQGTVLHNPISPSSSQSDFTTSKSYSFQSQYCPMSPIWTGSQLSQSEEDLSPYSRYAAKLKQTSHSSAYILAKSEQKSVLTGSHTETSVNSGSKTEYEKRETNHAENTSTKSILKESDVGIPGPKTSKSVSFSENMLEIYSSPADSNISGEQPLFSDAEDEQESCTLMDDPSRNDSQAVKKPKLDLSQDG